MVVGSSLVAVMAPVSSKEFLDTQGTIERGFTLKLVGDMIRTYSQQPISQNSKPELFCSVP